MAATYWPPDATLTASPTMGVAPLDVTFTISAVAHRGEIVNFTLDFGDGSSPASGTDLSSPIHHTYTAEGTFTAKVKVVDDSSLVGEDVAVVTVIPPGGAGGLNPPPTASIDCSPTDLLTLEPVTCNASGSTDSGGLLRPEIIVEYSWDFGDGFLTSGMMAIHEYGDNGAYTVTLTVIDDDGATGSATATINVQNRPPIALFESPGYTVDEETEFHSTSSDLDGTIESWKWDFDDSDGVDWDHPDAEGETAFWTYHTGGIHIVSLRVEDDDGAIATTSHEVKERPSPTPTPPTP